MSDILLSLPDLELDDRPITLSLWLVKKGKWVTEGDPMVEVMADGVTVDLPSPVDGILVDKLAGEGDTLVAGQSLAMIEQDIADDC